MDGEEVRRQVLIAFEYTHYHDDWVNPLADALAGPYGMADLLCRLIHNAYHIGQITKLRELRSAETTAPQVLVPNNVSQ